MLAAYQSSTLFWIDQTPINFSHYLLPSVSWIQRIWPKLGQGRDKVLIKQSFYLQCQNLRNSQTLRVTSTFLVQSSSFIASNIHQILYLTRRMEITAILTLKLLRVYSLYKQSLNLRRPNSAQFTEVILLFQCLVLYKDLVSTFSQPAIVRPCLCIENPIVQKGIL